MTDAQQRLERNLKNLLGENSQLIKVHRYEEVLDMLVRAFNKRASRTSIEFDGSMEPLCESRLKTAGFRFETVLNASKEVVTKISW